MRKLLLTLLFFPVLVIFVNKVSASEFSPAVLPAQTTDSKLTILPIKPDNSALTGETHNYSLVLKGNGNAVVLGRINFGNNGDGDLATYKLEIPGIKIDNLTLFQEIPQPVCVQYKTDSTCLKYEIPGYPDPYNSSYKKLTPTIDGDKITVNLAEPVKSASSSGLVLSYNTRSYTKDSLGKYTFSFQTPKVENNIQTLNLSIDTDTRTLYLKVNGEKVEYNQAAPTVALDSLSAKGDSSMRLLVPNIGVGGRVYKTVTNISPGEVVTISGSYANSLLSLNLSKILVFVGIILIIAVLFIALIKLGFLTRLFGFLNNRNLANSTVILVDFSFGLLVSALVGGSILFIKQFLGNQNYFGYNPDFSLGLLLMVMLIIFYLLILVLPAVLIGLKFGLKHLLIYILFTLFWMMVMVVGYVIIFLPGSSNPPTIIQPFSVKSSGERTTTDVPTLQTN